MLKLFIDGGCTGNGQKDTNKRGMISVVADESGKVLVEEFNSGGSNNVAEFRALLLAMKYAASHNQKEVIIITDSKNNLAWFKRSKFSNKQLRKFSDPYQVLEVHSEIKQLEEVIEVYLKWKPREENLAGHYIEEKHNL
jgi:ribonuclease HI